MARVKVKVERGNGLQQVVVIDTAATQGARLGRDVYLPDGAVATPASMRNWMGVSQGTAAPTTGSSLQSVLTNKGDLATRNSQVQRLGIGTQDQALRVSSAGLPEWRSGAALTKQDDTNVTLTLNGAPGNALLDGVELELGWDGTLSQERGGWGADISAAEGYAKFTAGVAAFSNTVPWGDIDDTPDTLAGYGITDAYTMAQVDALFTDMENYFLPDNYQPLSATLTDLAMLGDAEGVLTNDGYGNLSWAPAFDGDWSSLSGVPAVLAALGGLADAAGVLTNDGSGNLSWGTGGGSGTVTSVDLSVPSELSVSGGPVTTSGTLAVSWASGQTANRFLATPNGSPGAVSLRAIASGDLPAINLASSGAGGVTGTLPDANLSSNVALLAASNTWTGTATRFSHVDVRVQLYETDAGTDEKLWDFAVSNAVCALRTRTDANGGGRNALTFYRDSVAITDIELGNSTDTPNISLYGPVFFRADMWHKDFVGNNRIYFQNDGRTYFGAPTADGSIAYEWRNGSNAAIAQMYDNSNFLLNGAPVPRIISGGAAGGGRITISTSAPSGTPADGDMWFQREA